MPSTLRAWLTCARCGLCSYRKNVVLGRGVLPADVVFIGEGPGRIEDLTGTAFYGKAGRLLNKALEVACGLAKIDGLPRHYITNVVGCRPTDEKFGENRKPNKQEIEACRPRLLETICVAGPKVLVFLGETAKLQSKCIEFAGPRVYAIHPAACGYRGGASGPLFRPLVQSLASALNAWREISNG